MSYKCTCIKWDFLIAGAQSELSALPCSALIRFVLCSTLLLFSISLSLSLLLLRNLLTLWLFWPLCLCACVSLWRRRRHRCCGSHAPQT